ncbi:unnamed protein product [Sphagnum balticum]
MVKMNTYSESEDLQISKLNEFFLVADRIKKVGRSTRQGLGFGKFRSKMNPNGGGARFPVLPSGENAPLTNGSFILFSPTLQSFRASPSEPSDPPTVDLLSKEERRTIRASEAPAAPSSPARCSAPNRIAQAISERSDGGAREGHRQWSPSKILLSDIPTQASSHAAEAAGKSSPPQVLPSQSLSFPRFSESGSAFVGQKSGQGKRGATTTRQVAREDTSAARVKDSNEKNEIRASRKKSSTPTMDPPPNLTLFVHPGNEPRRTSPTGEETQGPSSPMDYSLELEAKFPKEMVIEMQGNAARKARRTVTGRMLEHGQEGTQNCHWTNVGRKSNL